MIVKNQQLTECVKVVAYFSLNAKLSQGNYFYLSWLRDLEFERKKSLNTRDFSMWSILLSISLRRKQGKAWLLWGNSKFAVKKKLCNYSIFFSSAKEVQSWEGGWSLREKRAALLGEAPFPGPAPSPHLAPITALFNFCWQLKFRGCLVCLVVDVSSTLYTKGEANTGTGAQRWGRALAAKTNIWFTLGASKLKMGGKLGTSEIIGQDKCLSTLILSVRFWAKKQIHHCPQSTQLSSVSSKRPHSTSWVWGTRNQVYKW